MKDIMSWIVLIGIVVPVALLVWIMFLAFLYMLYEDWKDS